MGLWPTIPPEHLPFIKEMGLLIVDAPIGYGKSTFAFDLAAKFSSHTLVDFKFHHSEKKFEKIKMCEVECIVVSNINIEKISNQRVIQEIAREKRKNGQWIIVVGNANPDVLPNSEIPTLRLVIAAAKAFFEYGGQQYDMNDYLRQKEKERIEWHIQNKTFKPATHLLKL